MKQPNIRDFSHRILLICSLFLLVPLLFHSVYLFVHDYRQLKQGYYEDLVGAIESEQAFIKEKFDSDISMLRLVVHIPEESRFSEKIKEEADFDSLFLVRKYRDSVRIIRSSQSAIVGKSLDLIFPADQGMFFYEDEEKQTKWVYVYLRVEGGDYLVGSIPAKEYLLPFKKEQLFMIPSLLTRKGRLFASLDEKLKIEGPIYPFNEKIFEEIKKIDEPFHVSFVVPNSEYKFVISITPHILKQISFWTICYRILSQLLFITIFGGLLVWFASRRLSLPLKHLADVMYKIGEGRTSERYKSDSFGFEINALGLELNEMVTLLVLHQDAKKELDIGASIQRNILPKVLPPVEGFDLAAAFASAKEVGGDFYDVFALPDGRVMLVIADGADKGISACIYSLCLRAMMRSFILSGNDLVKAMENANALFSLDTEENSMFVTAWVGILDPKSGVIEYVSCGHVPPLLQRAGGSIEELPIGGRPLGSDPHLNLYKGSLVLGKNDLIVLYTDGVTEAMNAQGLSFNRFKETICSYVDAKDMADGIIKAVADFTDKKELHDDITLLVVRKI